MYTQAEIDILKERELLALHDLYEQCGGRKWKHKRNWLTDRPVGKWYGVKTDDNGLVTHLYLELNNLTGCLPESIGEFREVRQVHLWNNQLTGCLPKSIGNWTQAQCVNVSCNNLTGALPGSIGNWTRIRDVGFYNNTFTGCLPSCIGNWTDIREFVISCNKFTGCLPESIGNWTSVRKVIIGWNDFSGCLPETIGAWNRRVYVDIRQCNMTKLPTCVTNNWTWYLELRRQVTDMVVIRRAQSKQEEILGISLLGL